MSKLIRRRFTGMMTALVVALAMGIPAYAGTIEGVSGESGQVALINPTPQLGCEVGCAPEAAGPTSQRVSEILQAGGHISLDVNNRVADPGPDGVRVTPEPGSWMLMATALVLAGGLGLLRLRSAW
ncbi:MAG: PEP-CTERM sorting domain-containing protein [Terriglobia bacterium]